MLKITNITIKNFLSVGNATQAIRLDQNGLTLILGSNMDATGGETRNGAGKSTILQAISYGLYGKPLTKIKVDNLINNINNKGLMVSIEFERDGSVYRIERGRKPQVLRWFVNDKEQKETNDALGENSHTQEEIERVVGMSHTMFLHVLAMNTFTAPFLQMKAAEQRAVIEELLGIMTLSQRAEALKKLVAATKEKVRDQEATIKATTEANSRIESMIRQTQAQELAWHQKHQKTLAALIEEIEAVEKIDFDAEIQAFDVLDQFLEREREAKRAYEVARMEASGPTRDVQAAQKELTLARDALKALDTGPVIARLNQELARKDAERERHVRRHTALVEKAASAEIACASADSQTCVCCGQTLTGTDHLATVIANLEAEVASIGAQIAQEQAEIDACASAMEDIADEIERAGTASEDATKDAEMRILEADVALALAIEAEKDAIERQAQAKAALAAIGEPPVTLFRSRDELYTAKQMFETLARDLETESQKTNPHTPQIESLKAGVQEIDYETINGLLEQQKHQDMLNKLLTNKDSFIRKKIIDQNLSYLNQRVNHYLEKLGLPHEVQFQSDLSVDITHLGRDFDFEQLSRGEMNRVIMATSLSFRDVWESLNQSVNLYFIDEMLDQGTCDNGAEAALNILMGIARDRSKNVFLISHRQNLVGRIDRTLLVRKEQGFSSFEEDIIV